MYQFGIEIYYVSANLSLTNREVACKSISERKTFESAAFE